MRDLDYISTGVDIILANHNNADIAAKRIGNALSSANSHDKLFIVARMRSNPEVKKLELDDKFFNVIFDKVVNE